MMVKAKYFVGALLLGAGFGSSWRLVSTIVEAAPKDVVGSPNIAVDTYNNRRGSFVLMSDGTVFSVKNGKTAGGVPYAAGTSDLGHPFVEPPSAANITSPAGVKGKVTGSQNVAVKALVRSDGTFVVFADGTVKLPANSDAAASIAVPRTLMGTLVSERGYLRVSPAGDSGVGSQYVVGDGFRVDSSAGGTGADSGNGYKVTVLFDTPFSSPPAVLFTGLPYITTSCHSTTDGFVAMLLPIAPPGSDPSTVSSRNPLTSPLTFIATGN